jgi:F-type H+-transporting ATPase subunit delta
MKVSKVAVANARRIFRLCQTNGRLDETRLRTAVTRLAGEKPRGYRGILVALRRLVRLETQRRHAVIESAKPLDEPTKLRIAADLGARYGAGLTIEYRTIPELVAGLRVRVGSDVWDGSVKARLDRLAGAF